MNHVARECKSKIKCFKCDKRHHISICPSNSREKPTPPEQEASHQPTPSEEHPRMQPQGHQPRTKVENKLRTPMSICLSMHSPRFFYKPQEPPFTTQRILVRRCRQDLYLTVEAKDHTCCNFRNERQAESPYSNTRYPQD